MKKNILIRFTAPILFCFLFLNIPIQAKTALEGKMDQIKGSFKLLAKSLQNPVETDKAKLSEVALSLRDYMKEARLLTPEKSESIPEDKRVAFIRGYQKKIDQSVAILEVMIQAIQGSNWSEAQKQLTLLKQVQKEGHQEYQSDHP